MVFRIKVKLKLLACLHLFAVISLTRDELMTGVLGKIEKVIGLKLRGKDKGQPLLPPGKK